MRQRFGQAFAALVLAASPAAAQANLNTYVAVGDSVTAGFMSGALLGTRQANSYPAQIARQAGVQSFQQPTISEPGIPPELALLSLVPTLIGPKASSPGAPTNLGLARPYNNLGVPGAISVDTLTRTTDQGGYHDIILRGRGTALAQAVGLKPTFVTLWIGNNDVLGAAIRGRAIDGVTLTPAAVFRAAYGQIVAALKTTGATIVAANLPDVTSIPFVTTIKPFVVDPTTGQPILVNGQNVPLIGPNGPLPPGSFVTLAASSLLVQGIGVPTGFGGRGTPLPDEVVLDPAEIAAIRARVEENDQAIGQICQAAGIPVLDARALLQEFATTGRVVGGVTLSSAFLTGGIFSYDGVHPSELGYALVANEWIRLINANGGRIPEVNLAAFMGFGVRGAPPPSRPTPPFEFTEEAYRNLLAAFPTVDRP